MKWHIDPSKLITYNKIVYVLNYYATGQLFSKTYYLNNILHNPNGPAKYEWAKNGVLVEEIYWFNGTLHNPNGPAIKAWHTNGVQYREVYMVHGKYPNNQVSVYRVWDKYGGLIYEK